MGYDFDFIEPTIPVFDILRIIKERLASLASVGLCQNETFRLDASIVKGSLPSSPK